MKALQKAGILFCTALFCTPVQVLAYGGSETTEYPSSPETTVLVLEEDKYNTNKKETSEQTSLTTGERVFQAEQKETDLPDQTEMEAGWKEDDKGLQLIKGDGTPARNEVVLFEGSLYAFDGEGYICSGYVEIEGDTYFADPEHNNALLTDIVYDGHYFDEDGIMRKDGWIHTKEGWQLTLSDSTLAKDGFFEEAGSTYYFNRQGIMQTGWIQANGKDYYLNSSGELIKDRFVQNKWYVDQDGVYHPEKWEKKDGFWLLLLGNGQYARDEFRISEDGHTYCFDADGHMSSGWKKKNGKDYYFVNSGEMARNRWIGGKWYLGPDGAWIPDGWKQLENGQYAWVYGDGTRVTSEKKKIGSEDYYFDENGIMQTGWIEYDEHWHYFDDNGAALKRQMIDDWYLNSTGIAYTGFDVEIAKYCDGVYDRVGMDLYKVFCWVPDHMLYTHLPIPLPTVGGRTELQNYARQAMTLKGNCYCYAALFWYLADGLGYHPEYVQGNVPYRNGTIGPHAWVVMYENGTKYYYDPEGSFERGQYFFRMLKHESPWNYDH